jgi:hypothetical protein
MSQSNIVSPRSQLENGTSALGLTVLFSSIMYTLAALSITYTLQRFCRHVELY